MELWVATTNNGKLNEFKNLLIEHKIEVHSVSEMSVYSPPPENGDSFEANARIKAKSLHALKKGVWVVADDSGLEVEGLNNLPGIHSARYAGPHARDTENTAKLLKMMGLRSANNRAARFRCVLVAYAPDGQEHVFEGQMEGEISRSQRGTEGFGYDNVFIPKGFEQTLAELGPDKKNQISHRAVAFKKLRELF